MAPHKSVQLCDETFSPLFHPEEQAVWIHETDDFLQVDTGLLTSSGNLSMIS
jgi:hypothetical protein